MSAFFYTSSSDYLALSTLVLALSMASSASLIFWSASPSSSEFYSVCLAFLVLEGGAFAAGFSSGLTLSVSSFGLLSGWLSGVFGFLDSDFCGFLGVSVGWAFSLESSGAYSSLFELSLTGIEFFFRESVCFLTLGSTFSFCSAGSTFSFSEGSSLLGASS